MKIAIPVNDTEGPESEVSPHFGRAAGFILFDSESGETETIANTSEHTGGSGKPPELLEDAGVDVVLCANLGRRAVAMFKQLGIGVCTGASGTARETFEAWKNDELDEATEEGACRGHH